MADTIDIRAGHKHLKTLTTAAVRSMDDRGWGLAGDFGLRLLLVAGFVFRKGMEHYAQTGS